MSINSSIQNNLLRLLTDILRDHHHGIKEYDLLMILRKKNLPVFSDDRFSDTLVLFRAHFMLFHLLYKLHDFLLENKTGIIEIHCLKIVLLPWKSADSNLPKIHDSLKEYYDDLTNMEEMQQVDVDEMIGNFWKDYTLFQMKPECLSVLNLDCDSSRDEIKQRYRQLAKIHHPDHGGCPEKFNEITNAAQNLLA